MALRYLVEVGFRSELVAAGEIACLHTTRLLG